MKKLHQGKSVRVQYGNAHEIPLPAKDHKKLMKAHSMGKGMVLTAPHLTGGSFLGDTKYWYENNIRPEYRAGLETIAKQGLMDLGGKDVGMKGGSFLGDTKYWYENNIRPEYRAGLETIAKQGLMDLGGKDVGMGVMAKRPHKDFIKYIDAYKNKDFEKYIAAYKGKDIGKDFEKYIAAYNNKEFDDYLNRYKGKRHAKGSMRGKGILEDIMRGPSIEQAVALQNQLMRPPSIEQAVALQNQFQNKLHKKEEVLDI
jgi:hypothetical protein